MLAPGMRVLDAGGTASLFGNYLASLGLENHSIDLNPELVEAGRYTAEVMGWPLHPFAMDITPEDVRRHFFACDDLEPLNGAVFHDNGKRYLALPRAPKDRYTFGAVFLQKSGVRGPLIGLDRAPDSGPGQTHRYVNGPYLKP